MQTFTSPLTHSHTLAGNTRTTYYELNSIYGHDTFLLDVNNIGTALKVCSLEPPITQYIHCNHSLTHLGILGVTTEQFWRVNYF